MCLSATYISLHKNSDMKGYYTAVQVINEALAGIRDFDRKYYDEAAMYFLRGYRDFKLFDEYGCVKEAWKPITPINTINYPEDVMRLIQVGVIADNEFFPFTRSEYIVSPSTAIDEMFDTSRGEGETLRRVPSTGYGAVGANVEYYFKDEPNNRRIILSRIAVDTILFSDRQEALLRYVSTGVDSLETTYIPNEAANMLIAYIEYKMCESRPDAYARTYIADKKENYLEARNMYSTLQMPSLDEMIDMIYETSGQNVRR